MRIDGLPWKAELSHVNFFFQGYKFIHNSIIFGKDETGKSNGLGAILFHTAQEATRAVQERDKKYV